MLGSGIGGAKRTKFVASKTNTSLLVNSANRSASFTAMECA